MVGAIIGDLVGSRFEFKNHRDKHFEFLHKKCRFTDDTVCTIAIADAIVKNIPYKDSIVKWCRKYSHAGYSHRFQQWIKNPIPYASFGNGAIMRISPFGYTRQNVFADIDSEVYKAVSCSHNTDIARQYALCFVQGIQDCLRGDRKGILKRVAALGIQLDESLDHLRKTNRFDATCQGSFPQAVLCFKESRSFEDAIRNAISIGGDSDTIANITGALAGAYYGVPPEMVAALKDYLPEDMYEVIMKFQQEV